MTIRVLLADDQELVRAGFRMILETQANIQVVGEAADGLEAVAATRRLRPEVVLMDIRMPNLDGLQATKQIVAAGSGSRVVILTTFDLDEYVYQALAAGASGFLLKNAPPEQLISAVRVVAAGDGLLAPSITRRVIEQFTQLPRPGGTDTLVGLTAREREVLKPRRSGAVQRRDRRAAGRQRRHGQEPRSPPAGQVAASRPRPGRGAGLRVRPRATRTQRNDDHVQDPRQGVGDREEDRGRADAREPAERLQRRPEELGDGGLAGQAEADAAQGDAELAGREVGVDVLDGVAQGPGAADPLGQLGLAALVGGSVEAAAEARGTPSRAASERVLQLSN